MLTAGEALAWLFRIEVLLNKKTDLKPMLSQFARYRSATFEKTVKKKKKKNL